MASFDNIERPEEMIPTVDEIIEKEDHLIAMANEHIHAQRVASCTYAQGGEHSINCGRAVDASVLEYQHLASKGLIRVKDYEEWGCVGPEEEHYHRDIANTRVRKAFMPMDWNKGFTGRGMSKTTLEITHAIGPSDEIEPTGMSPFDLNGLPSERGGSSRSIGTSAHNVVSNVEELSPNPRSEILNGDEVGPFGERSVDEDLQPVRERRGAVVFGHSNERDDDEAVGPFDETILRVEPTPTDARNHLSNNANRSCLLLDEQAVEPSNERSPPELVDITSQMMNALDEVFSEATTGAISNPTEGPLEASTSGATHPSVDDFKTTPIIGTKRGRQPSPDSEDEDSEVEECVSRPKRLCISRINGTNTLGQVRDIVRDIASRDPQLHNNPTTTIAGPIPQANKKRDRETFEDTYPEEESRVLIKNTNTKRARRSGLRETASSEDILTEIHSQGCRDSAYSTTTTTTTTTTGKSDASTGETSTAETLEDIEATDSNASSMDNGNESNNNARQATSTHRVHHIKLEFDEDEDDNVIDNTPPMDVRPTYQDTVLYRIKDHPGCFKKRLFSELNEADGIVVMSVKGKGSNPPLILRDNIPTPWTAEDDEKLRFWVQDYVTRNWLLIAYSLMRGDEDCRVRYREIIVALNNRAGRHQYAGLPKSLIPVTANTPAPDAAPTESSATRTPPVTTQEALTSHAPEGEPPAPPALPTPPTITASSVAAAAAPPPPPKSGRVLRPRIHHAVPRFQCGNIIYDTKARSLPKVSKKGTLVDSKGNVILGTEGEIRIALKNTQLRRKAGQKLVLNAGPDVQDEEDDASTNDVLRVRGAGAAKRGGKGKGKGNGKGARRYGVDRRAGNQKK
ncbi:hypothetical protein OEA41_006323 [Lepraria neglecta]|uniref:Myb-like domain-containing protein n=1 Tax=Lepraria neglecta TaxID=209136 RepID=A0AAD9Z7S3_9LECA|nr:hypothetical protein OEA41_006323 [Lepraria neglecta]